MQKKATGIGYPKVTPGRPSLMTEISSYKYVRDVLMLNVCPELHVNSLMSP